MKKYTWQSDQMVIRKSSVQGKQQYPGILSACYTPKVVYCTNFLIHHRTWAASDSFAQHSSDADWRLAVCMNDKYNSNSNRVEIICLQLDRLEMFLLKEDLIFRSFTWTCTCNSGPLIGNNRADHSPGVVWCIVWIQPIPWLDQMAVFCQMIWHVKCFMKHSLRNENTLKNLNFCTQSVQQVWWCDVSNERLEHQ